MPHGIKVDFEGNTWLTDIAAHQVFKFDREKRLVLELGTKLTPGRDARHFCQPTDVAVLESDGRFFVSDGHCNSRVVRFSREGEYLGEWPLDERDALFSFAFSPHSLALNEARRLLCVADFDNFREQCIQLDDGAFLAQAMSSSNGSVKSVAFSSEDDSSALYALVQLNASMTKQNQIYLLHDGRVKGSVNLTQEVNSPHGMAVGKSTEGEDVIFVASHNPPKVFMFKRLVGKLKLVYLIRLLSPRRKKFILMFDL
jgi:hypothetical protein